MYRKKTSAAHPTIGTAALMAVVSLCGCGGGSGSGASRLAGLWVQDSIAIPKGGSAECGAIQATLTSATGVQYGCAAGSPNVSIFGTDGTYTNYASGTPSGDAAPRQQGTWQLSGSTLRITITSPAATAGTVVGTIKFQDVPAITGSGVGGLGSAAGGTVGTGTGFDAPNHTFVFTYTGGPYTGFTATYREPMPQ